MLVVWRGEMAINDGHWGGLRMPPFFHPAMEVTHGSTNGFHVRWHNIQYRGGFQVSRLEERQPIQVPEALAHVLGFPVTTVKALVKDGDIETVKVGKHRYAMPEAVEEYLDTLKALSTPGILRGEVL